MESLRIHTLPIIKRVFLAIILTAAVSSPTLASDNSNNSHNLKFYNDDNQNTWSSNTEHVWQNFEMFFFQNRLYKAFRHRGTIQYYSHDPSEAPIKSPAYKQEFKIVDNYWNDADFPSFRFCVFKGKLYLFYGKFISGPSDALFYRVVESVDEVPDNDGNILYTVLNFSPETRLWAHLTAPGAGRPIWGIVAKVMNDQIYLLVQHAINPLIVFTFDGEKLTNYDQDLPPSDKIWNNPNLTVFPIVYNDGNLLLDGEVFLKVTEDANESQECIAFVARDDVSCAYYTDCKGSGLSYLYAYDPHVGTKGAITRVKRVPGNWKDLAVSSGNVELCEPYSLNSINLWGLPWDNNHVQHTQFVFNDDGKTGKWNPSGWVDLTSRFSDAKHAIGLGGLGQEDRRLLTAAATAIEITDGEGRKLGLQRHTWVWWFGHHGATHQNGRSLKYESDYLKFVKNVDKNTAEDAEISDAWVFVGVVMGLPPFYTNGYEFNDSGWVDYNEVSFGIETTETVTTTVTQDASFSFGYSRGGILKAAGVGGQFGISYTHAVQSTKEHETSVKVGKKLTYSPSYYTDPDYEKGSQAWGLFYAPTVSNEIYQVYAPDRTTDLGFTVYYTSVSQADLIDQPFHITNPSGFFDGISVMPNILAYESWNQGDLRRDNSTESYNLLASSAITCNGGKNQYNFGTTEADTEKKSNKNSLKVEGGAWGFNSAIEGGIEVSSSVKVEFGRYFEIDYGLRGFDPNPDPKPDDFGRYLKSISLQAYLLTPKTEDAFWIPESCRTEDRKQFPWCITWYVNSYHNMDTPSVMIGADSELQSVTEALAKHSSQQNLPAVILNSLSESTPITISGQSVMLKGHPSTLTAAGLPTLTLSAPWIRVIDGYLRLEDLIISNGGALLPLVTNGGHLRIENCILTGGGGHGINQSSGHVSIEKSYLSGNLGDGLNILGGSAALINCEVVNNFGNGVLIENATARVTHSGILGNGLYDISSLFPAELSATNSVFGNVGPETHIVDITNCLVEYLPDTVSIGNAENCLLNVSSGLTVSDEEIAELPDSSPCVEGGLGSVNVDFDIKGRFRDEIPDIGPLELARLMEIESIDWFHLTSYMQQENFFGGSIPRPYGQGHDTLLLRVDLKVPEGFSLKKSNGNYTIAFGDAVISSEDSIWGAVSPDGTFAMFVRRDFSRFSMRYLAKRNRLSISVSLVNAELYPEIFRHVIATHHESENSSWQVYLPLRVSAGGLYQTGEKIVSFDFKGHHFMGMRSFGTGSNIQLNQ